MAQIHPAHRLACWLLAVVAVQSLSGWLLAVGLACALLLGARIRTRWGRLAWRARWLLASLLAILAWGVAGEPLLADGGAWIPTYEGLAAGGVQLGRLLLVLAAVATLLETTPIDRLMSGGHALLQPLRRFGLDVDRAVVRLTLALHYAERMPAGDWRSLLDPTLASDAPAAVRLSSPPATARDWLLLGSALAATLSLIAA